MEPDDDLDWEVLKEVGNVLDALKEAAHRLHNAAFDMLRKSTSEEDEESRIYELNQACFIMGKMLAGLDAESDG